MKCTPVQALRLCTGRTANRGSRGIALLFLDHDTGRGEGSASRPGRSLPQGKPGTHCTGGWVRKILPPPGFDARTVQPVASRYTDCVTWPTAKNVELMFVMLRCMFNRTNKTL